MATIRQKTDINRQTTGAIVRPTPSARPCGQSRNIVLTDNSQDSDPPEDKGAENSRYAKDGRAVPFGRLSRFARFGGMAAGVAGGMFFDGVQQLATGKRPKLNDLLMTPTNMLKVTNQLANMRGAAMKLGQMLSMDTGDFLPRELTDILGQLRSNAQHMPRRQLDAQLLKYWGEDWQDNFAEFSYRPLAAASIGQVHRATTKAGDDLAIKVQYPGVSGSIDSDVNNVASLLRVTNLVPQELDIKPLLEEAKRQLHEEADYQREAKYLARFAQLLDGDKDYQVPQLHAPLTTDCILAMTYIESVSIEQVERASQEVRDRLATLLLELLMRELFEFKLMQTDPNFANYRYNAVEDRLVLLDFGATQEIREQTMLDYRTIMRAVLTGDEAAGVQAATDIGFIASGMKPHHQKAVLDITKVAMEPLQKDEPFDFSDTHITQRLSDMGMELATERDLWHLPPVDTLFIQRKFSGVYLLASRLKAKVNVRAIIAKYLV